MEETRKTLAIKCKYCDKQFGIAVPAKSGTFKFVCPSCKREVAVRFATKSEKTKKVSNDGLHYNGCLEVVRYGGMLGGIANTRFPLKVGTNVVGRADKESPSDINIKNDPAVSRRSIAIDVIPKENGYFFKMKVLSATNPVLHNDKPLAEGEVIYLNYGDGIKLGRTTLRFNKLRK